MKVRWLIFKSSWVRDRPWLVFSPEDRAALPLSVWQNGFATWQEAMAAVLQKIV